MDPISTSTEASLVAEVEDEVNEISDYISTAYNHTVSFVQDEMDKMNDHQKIGVALIFFISSALLITSLLLLFCGRKTCCRWFRREEKYVVYRKMVEFDHIIALDPPKSDRGKLPI